MSGQHTQGRLEAFDNAGPQMQSYSQSSGLHGTGKNRLKLIAGCFNDIGGEEIAAANARRLAACWNACEGVSTEGVELIADKGGMFQVGLDRVNAERELAAARALLAEVLPSMESLGRFKHQEMFPLQPEEVLAERIRAFLKGGAS